MVQHQIYYVSRQYLKNGDFRETTPNGGRSKIEEISFILYADLPTGERVSLRVSFYVDKERGKAILSIRDEDEYGARHPIMEGKFKRLYNGTDFLTPYRLSENLISN